VELEPHRLNLLADEERAVRGCSTATSPRVAAACASCSAPARPTHRRWRRPAVGHEERHLLGRGALDGAHVLEVDLGSPNANRGGSPIAALAALAVAPA
jgi:hypothetical protein